MNRSLLVLLSLLGTAGAFAADAPETRPPLRTAPARFDSSHAYDVMSYSLDLAVTMANDSLWGRQRISAMARAAGLDTVALNCADLAVDSVLQDGAARGFRIANDTLYAGIAPAGAGGHFALDIHYRLGNRGTARRGYYWYPQGGEALKPVAYTVSAPQDARCWMPCFDEPWDKADSGCAFSVTVPDGYAVAANGLLTDTVCAGGRTTWTWREDRAIATYLMAFHVSQYAHWSDTARTAAGDTVPLEYYVWPVDSAASRTVFATVPGMMDAFTGLFGPYPFAKYGMAAVAPFMFGGMENQGMTTIHRGWVTGNDQYGIAHELSHMWWGDLVTCGTWADIWLNEGFASYCEALYYERLTGNAPGQYMASAFSQALSGNALTYPIYDPPMALIYDYSMEYAKGAWVTQMLRGVLGDPLFFPMMRAYRDSFAQGTAVTADFQRIAEHHYGAALGWFFDQWVHRAGHPAYGAVVYHRTHPDSLSAILRLTQTSTTGEPYTMPIVVACSTAAGLRRTTVWDSLPFQQWTVTDTLPIQRLLIDPDNLVLKVLTSQVPQLKRVVKGFHQLTPVWARFTADPAGVAGYNVYRSFSTSGPFLRVNAAVIDDTMYADTGLTAGVMHYYAITAVCGADTCCETAFSNITGQKPLGVAGDPGSPGAPLGASLQRNSPNPFRQATTFAFDVPVEGPVRLALYNVAGQRVRTLVDGTLPAGRHTARWDGRDDRGRRAAAGVYCCRLAAGGAAPSLLVQLVR
ncbi:MAG: hypothetical protein MUF78_03980 [Candidatus Edwardsbacteria bacterium]|jgi:hypothetical protein|nr:hypothetical protein [Candidatus Edwardsbacteria bacterium]